MVEIKSNKQKKRRIAAPSPGHGKTVKSAARAFDILEYFDDVQKSLTLTEIASSLGYPPSSTSALLQSLVTLGYLNYDPRTRTYIPSTRVALLGSWIKSDFLAEGAIISLMKELNKCTGDTIVVAMRNGLYAQYIHVLQATNPARLHLTLGTARPLIQSGAGYALLSHMPDQEVAQLVKRTNATVQVVETSVNAKELLQKLTKIRKQGYAFTHDLVAKGTAIIAAALPQISGQPPMAVGIGGISEVMRPREKELAGILKEQIDHYLPNSNAGLVQRK